MTSSRTALLATAALLALAPFAASAQVPSTTQPETPQASAAPDEVPVITVTARKQAEDLLKVPVAITAFTGEALETRGVKTFTDLANLTPNLTTNVSAAGGARADRSTQLFIVRGMNPASSLNPTASIFLNGVPIGPSNMLQNIDDVDHVEVLKGPQAAYFGRGTFAGAINVVATPAGDRFGADVSGEVATRNTYRGSASVTIPIMPGHFSIRVGGLYDKRDGSYKNKFNPGETLGDQKTYGGHVAVTIRPDDNLTIKGFYTNFRNEDGPAATGLILANGPAAFNQTNCTINNAAWFCGTLPDLSSASPAQNTTITTGERTFFTNPGGLISSKDIVKHFGLKRFANHGDISVDWKVLDTGLTLSYLTGWNRNRYSVIQDLANINGGPGGQYPGYAGFPFLVENRDHDYSHEVRLSSDPAKRLRVLVGGSYLDFYHEAINYSLGGTPGPAPRGAPTISQTKGAFFSLGFDITPELILTAEGRYQWDTEKSLTIARITAAKGTSKNFLPRVSLQYTFTPGVMAYATFSRGANPVVFNTQYSTLPVASQQALATTGVGTSLVVRPEILDNYEVGLKGRALDGRLTFALAAYYDKWKNQINANVYNFAVNDPANPYNIPSYVQYRPNSSIFIYTFQDNSAASTAKGIELETTIIPIEHVTLNLSGAYSDITYDRFNCTSNCAPYPTAFPGFNAAGKHLVNSPRFSGTIGAQYRHDTGLLGATSFFGRVDYLYHDGLYVQTTNTAKTPESNIFNFRAGLDFPHFSIEGFVTNAFNERAYTTGFQNSNFGGGFAPALMVGLPTLRTAGVRVRAKF